MVFPNPEWAISGWYFTSGQCYFLPYPFQFTVISVTAGVVKQNTGLLLQLAVSVHPANIRTVHVY